MRFRRMSFKTLVHRLESQPLHDRWRAYAYPHFIDERSVDFRREGQLSFRELSQRGLWYRALPPYSGDPAGGRVGIGWSEALAPWPALSSFAASFPVPIARREHAWWRLLHEDAVLEYPQSG